MAIADRIEEMYTHVGDVYDTITNVELPEDKNIENIPRTIKDSYLEIMNNGTQQVWDNWDKVNGTGETLTLNNTEEAPMTIALKGNTYQDSTTGKNLFDISKVISNWNSSTNIGVRNNNDGTLTISTPSTSSGVQALAPNKLSDYCPSLQVGDKVYITATTTGTQKYVYLTTSASVWTYGTLRTISQNDLDSVVLWYSSGVSATATISNIMISTSGGEYEPYTNGASPNPDYPQDIHVVSGDNSIEVVGVNVFDEVIENGYINYQTGVNVAGDNYRRSKNYIKVNPSTTYYLNMGEAPTGAWCGTIQYDKNKNFLEYKAWSKDTTLTTRSDTEYIRFYLNATSYDKICINVSNASINGKYYAYEGASYPISLGDIELLKIGTYQDKIDKSSGKNLFDKTTITSGQYVNQYGNMGTDATAFVSDYIEITPNTDYYISGRTTWNSVGLYDSSKTFIERPNYTATGILNITNTNVKYIRINASATDINTLMLNEGEIALPYEPYGTGWYVKKEIGKVVLDGTQTISYELVGGYDAFKYNATDMFETNSGAGLSNYYQNITPTNDGRMRLGWFNTYIYFFNNTSRFSGSVANFKNWLSTNNLVVYYRLATPTYTLIEDSTLINQLETIKKSYEGQTNITQENDDMPFELDVEALKGDE